MLKQPELSLRERLNPSRKQSFGATTKFRLAHFPYALPMRGNPGIDAVFIHGLDKHDAILCVYRAF